MLLPNPSKTGIFHIATEGFNSNIKLNVFDVTGCNLMYKEISESEGDINLSTFSKGIYYIKAKSEDKTEVKSVIHN